MSMRPMLDFASALYLGLRHPSATLGQWDALTLGRPAASSEPPGAVRLAAELAHLTGRQAAVLLPSTLHLFWDLLGMLSAQRVVLLIDDASYPIARWGAGCTALHGTPLRLFAHASAPALRRLAQRFAGQGRRPVILADGHFPGAPGAPLAAYAELARQFGGYLVLDDTQALGVLGHESGPLAPYGSGGGGSARQHRLIGPHVVVGASLAKGFGAPLAVLGGSASLIHRFKQQSQTRSHVSPPSVAAVRAGLRAVRANRACGDVLRRRLWQRVAHWRDGLARRAIVASGGSFPVQTLALNDHVDGALLHAQLRQAGIDTVLQHIGAQTTVSFLICADHTGTDVERALTVLAACLRRQAASCKTAMEE